MSVTRNAVDAIMAYSTDGRILSEHLVLLEDDKHFNPPYYGMMTISQKTAKEHPEVVKALEPLQGLIDTQTMQKLNAQVDVDGRSIEDVARSFLQEKGLLPAG